MVFEKYNVFCDPV